MDTSSKQRMLSGNKRKSMSGVRQEQKEQDKSGQKKVILSWEYGQDDESTTPDFLVSRKQVTHHVPLQQRGKQKQQMRHDNSQTCSSASNADYQTKKALYHSPATTSNA